MDLAAGDRVLVNVAPFIGSERRVKDSVTCEILAVTEDSVQVRPEPPCRGVELWVQTRWIESRLGTPAVCAGAARVSVSA